MQNKHGDFCAAARMRKEKPMSEPRKHPFVEFLEAISVAVVLALVIRTFIVQAYTIPSGSMLETLQIGDYLLVNKFSYGVKIPFTHDYLLERSGPEHGDIIVFEFPDNPDVDYIKRVIGVPGDVIEVRDKEVYRNGQRLEEPYAVHGDPGYQMRRDNFGPVTVPGGSYFCLGDNRDFSQDSRFWQNTFVRKEAIRGKALFIYWSMEGFTDIRWGRIGSFVH
jgi:signal peptidase I